MWIWIWVTIIVVSLVVQILLGRRLWRAVRELRAETRALGKTTAMLELELGKVGAVPVVGSAVAPRHGGDLDTQA